PEDITGTWKGNWENDGIFGEKGTYVLTISQQGTSVSGTAELTASNGWVTYKIDGSISNNQLKYRETLQDSYPKTYWCSSLDYTFPYYPPTTVLDGTYKCNIESYHTGICHLEKQ
ncbi:MAG: hypothetical protein ABIC40_00845, partial [bacterium]